MQSRKRRLPAPAAVAPSVPPSIEFRELGEVQRFAGNARQHGSEQVRALVALISECGWTFPILLDDADEIVAGHGRLEAAALIYSDGGSIRMLDGTPVPPLHVPVLVARGWTEEQKRLYRVADNHLAELSTWDESLLKIEIGELQNLGADLTLTGFDTAAIGRILSDGENDPNAHWNGMPEFDQADKTAFRSLPIHFKDQAAVDAFAKLIGQKITENTRFAWFPEIEIETYADKQYARDTA